MRGNEGLKHTVDTIDLDQIFLYGLLITRTTPAESGSVGTNASEADIGRLWYVDAEDVDELGDRFP